MDLFLIAIGGGLGSVTRYLSSHWVVGFAKSPFPWGTFFVNASGSLVAGILYFFLIRNFENFDPRLKHLLFTGFLGGFTTFSTFSLDFFRLFTAGQYPQAFAYAFASVLLSILALFFGFYSSKLLFS